jgi:hypothetical protein
VQYRAVTLHDLRRFDLANAEQAIVERLIDVGVRLSLRSRAGDGSKEEIQTPVRSLVLEWWQNGAPDRMKLGTLTLLFPL